jgi:hypothetical protein
MCKVFELVLESTRPISEEIVFLLLVNAFNLSNDFAYLIA